MKQITFEHLQKPAKPSAVARNPKEDLINQIVDLTSGSPTQKTWRRKMIAIQTNTFGWDTTDLHAVLKKHNDPTIRNFTGWVTWRFGLTKKKQNETKKRQTP